MLREIRKLRGARANTSCRCFRSSRRRRSRRPTGLRNQASASVRSPSASASAARSSASPGAWPRRATSWETAAPCASRVRSRPTRNPNGIVATSACDDPVERVRPVPGGVEELGEQEDGERRAARDQDRDQRSALRRPPARARRMISTQLTARMTTATPSCMASRASDSGWSPSTISRFFGAPGSSNSSDGSCSTVTGEVRAPDHPALGPGLEAAARERDQQMAADRGEQRVERDADREQHVVVRRAEARREPGEARRDHELPGRVRGPPPPGEQAGPDERPADEQPQHRLRPRIVDVVAGERDRRDHDAGDEAREGEREE